MALNKLYNRQTWHNNASPALNETNLNILSQAVDEIDTRVVDIAGTVMETVPLVEEQLEDAQELEARLEELTENPPYIGANGNWYVWDTNTGHYVDSGVDASITVSVDPETVTLPAGSDAYVQNVGTSTDPILRFGIPRGNKGDTGGATPGSDISDTVVDTITASSADYPEPAASETMKVIIGKIKKYLDDLKTKKADKVTSATDGHLAGLDTNGNLTDSGKSSSAVIPSGGTTGQYLKKSSGTDYATEWGDVSSGGHTILNGSGSAMNQRGKLQFSSKVSDDSSNDKTVVYSGSEETITIGHTTGSSGTGKWLTQNNTIDGTVYGYKYSATLSKPIYGVPKVERVAAKGSGTTDASITAWNCIAYIGLDPDYPTTLNLYASSVPSVDINIVVKWEGGAV